jgi:hypothetical protein
MKGKKIVVGGKGKSLFIWRLNSLKAMNSKKKCY